MAAPVTRIPLTRLPALPAASTPEQRYWETFKSHLLIQEYGAIKSINFSPVSPHDFAVTASTLVKVYSSKTRAVSKTISRFQAPAQSGSFRSDGKVLVAGDDNGLIQVFDIGSRAVIKTWDEHNGNTVNVTKFSPTNVTQVLSASDDKTVRLWDLTSLKSTHTFIGNQDYVRAASFVPGSPHSVVSGGYDRTVRLWDSRSVSDQWSMEFNVPAPVDALLILPGGTTILASNGPTVHVWDVIAAKRVAVLHNHQKSITSLALSTGPQNGGRRVLTGALDGHVKVYDPTTWKVVHGVKYPSPILAIGISPDEKHLVVGMSNGLLSVRTRSSGREKEKAKEKERVLDMIAAGIDPITGTGGPKSKTSAQRRRTKGMDYKGEGADIVVQQNTQKKKERAWEQHLRRGNYDDALDFALMSNQPHITVFTMFGELRHRNALNAALANRDENTLKPILRWLIKYLPNPQYVSIIVEVSLSILDMYSHDLGKSPDFDKLMRRLHLRVKHEVENSKQSSLIVGMLNMLLAGSTSG
ncbi:WD40 repeat-like protein [Choiromyces venosus 120613-1]|uniref:WD40 repeat-like protein n=1 Tax=Choiromyces venosus 120613-1 TaxID=1336337 RepID=A0A3N4K1D7_9PEZI|nr:WD40 repeat-like protein [Choiromyces venosus 120613-1]